ncbi:MAG: hypothetical protein HKN85_07070, partial [Gammaproteobacteria bacterium]|nr:hypothetical protein [Gammaproteobacteria bacterium]
MNPGVADSASWLPPHSGMQMAGQQLDWLQEQRQQALVHFAEVGLPGIRDEEWRYTNLRALKSNVYAFSTPNPDADISLPATDHPRLVIVDGFYREDLSSVGKLTGGVVFTSLAEILATRAELVKAVFGSGLPKLQHGFSALNTAYCQDGFV